MDDPLWKTLKGEAEIRKIQICSNIFDNCIHQTFSMHANKLATKSYLKDLHNRTDDAFTYRESVHMC